MSREERVRTELNITGSHPLHGSDSGINFHINIDDNVWYCYRCKKGGGPLEWLAVNYGLITCSEAGPKCIDKEKFKTVLKIADELGYEIAPRSSAKQINII